MATDHQLWLVKIVQEMTSDVENMSAERNHEVQGSDVPKLNINNAGSSSQCQFLHISYLSYKVVFTSICHAMVC